jgi:tetratricopeptide (TPR) repeat protein
VWEEKTDTANALKDYTEAISLKPKQGELRFRRAHILLSIAEEDKALDDLNTAIALIPEYAQGRVQRAYILERKGRYDEAMSDCFKAIRLDPTIALAYSIRGSILANSGNLELAVKNLSKAIQLNADEPWNHYNRGKSLHYLGRYAEAAKDYAEAIRLKSDVAQFHNGIARLRATCMDERYRSGKEAIESAKKACELSDWKSHGFLETLAAAYAECGDFGTAMQYQEQALKLCPMDKQENCNRKLALYRDNEPLREKPKELREPEEDTAPIGPK